MLARRALALAAPLALLVACAAPSRQLVREEIAAAEVAHDRARLEAALGRPGLAELRRTASGQAEIAFALYRVAGLAAAAPELEATCARADVEPRLRQNACSLSRWARLVAGRPVEMSGPAVATIPLVGKGPIALIKVVVGGEEALFAFDTGAEASVLARAFSQKQHIPFLEDAPRHAGDAGGRSIPLWPGVVDRLQAGELEIRNLPVSVISFPDEIPLAGILAPYDAFPGALVELDRRAGVIRVYRDLTAEAWRAQVGEPAYEARCTWFEENGFFVPVSVDGKPPRLFLFDTGANETGLLKAVAVELGFSPEAGTAEGGAGAGGAIRYLRGFEGTFAVGDAPATRLPFVIQDRAGDPRLDRGGSLGFDWTAGRRIAMPPDGRRILFTAPAASESP